MADLAGEEFISYRSGARLRELLESAGESAGFSPRVTLESNESGRIRRLVSRGLGVAILPRSDASREGADVAVCALVSPSLTRDITLAWREGRRLGPAAAAFLELSLETFSSTGDPPHRQRREHDHDEHAQALHRDDERRVRAGAERDREHRVEARRASWRGRRRARLDAVVASSTTARPEHADEQARRCAAERREDQPADASNRVDREAQADVQADQRERRFSEERRARRSRRRR